MRTRTTQESHAFRRVECQKSSGTPSVIAYTDLTDEQIMRLEKYGFRRFDSAPMENGPDGIEELLPRQ
ncbi:hypothetical protein B1A75_18665 [Geobacillus sp. LEMMY01]|nr:hypothetical protein B1A75_18665 [Geobacillus sp. LEMMY01]